MDGQDYEEETPERSWHRERRHDALPGACRENGSPNDIAGVRRDRETEAGVAPDELIDSVARDDGGEQDQGNRYPLSGFLWVVTEDSKEAIVGPE